MNGIPRRLSRIAMAASLLAGLLHGLVVAQTLPDLFQKLKSEVNTQSWTEASRTLATLQTESAKPGNEASLAKLEGPIAFYRGVCEASLDQNDEAIESFVRFLRIQPNATVDAAKYSKKVVAAFDEARKAAVDRAPSLASAYGQFRPPPDRSGRDAADQFWADGPVKWILTDEEKRDWSRLSDPNARVGFVESFWDSRATLPGSDGRSFREEFERRVAFADVYLAHDPETRGSLTDRGMVFVLLGPPTNARRRALRSADDPSAPSGESRVETQEVKLAMKGSGGTTSKKALIWGTFQGAEHRALSTEEEYLEVWEYGAERLPRGNPYPRVDVHYVTKKGGGKNMLQPTTSSRTTLAAAKSAAAPRSGPGR